MSGWLCSMLAACGSDAASASPATSDAGDASVEASDGSIADVLPNEAWSDAAGDAASPEDASGEAGPPVCSPRTCAQLGAECGSAPDGCGGKVDCGTCASGKLCGGGGVNRCGTNACSPKTCAQVSAACGFASDGCSEALYCGGCPAPKSCGGGGLENQCGCSPRTCAQLGAECGTLPDGCEGTIECGKCAVGMTCGGNGPNKCGSAGCNPKTCAQVQASCGWASDGCGEAIDCGECQGYDVCGGTGVANQCGCAAKTCAQLGATCGDVMGTCGTIQCGDCTSPDTCGGAGTANQCGCVCQLPHATTGCLGGVCSVAKCDAGWANCDGEAATGCETAVDSSLANCGSCGNTCALANAVSKCSGGLCVIASCLAGYSDCDGSAANGCEVNIKADPEHCGTCTTTCPPSGATPVCNNGVCGVSNCPAGKADCDGNAGNGCEIDTTSSAGHCGFCNNPCALPNASAKCVSSACQVDKCSVGFGNCDGNPANGCETSTAGSVQNCGSCGHVCSAGAHATVSCLAGACVQACLGGWGDCDANASNGCEVDLAHDGQNCGACKVACQATHGSAGCSYGHCVVTSCNPGWSDCDGIVSNGCETAIGAQCQSAPNACGQVGFGFIECGGCNASQPENPPGYGDPCSSAPNVCGQTASGWVDCGGCNASPPADPPGYGSPCNSLPNACGQSNPGTVGCGGCSASPPPNPPGYDVCTPSGSASCPCASGKALNEYCYDSQGGFNVTTLGDGCAASSTVDGVDGCGKNCQAPCTDSCSWNCHDGGNAQCEERGYGPVTAATCTCD